MVRPPFRYPQKNDLLEALKEEGILHCSGRTLERDIKKLKNEYGVSVAYDARRRGYYLHIEPDEDISDFTQFVRLLERRERMEFLGSSVDSLSTAQYLLLEDNHYFQGNSYLPLIWEALRQKRVVRFLYKAFSKTAKPRERWVEPGLILEDRNRWYLVGREIKTERVKVKTFGLDRILELKLTEDSFTGDPAREYREQKPHIIGITYEPDEPLQTIVLRFTPRQSPYIKSLPLHPTQQILAEDEQGLTVSIEVVINYELEREILSHGERVEVLAPERLRQQITKRLKQCFSYYPELKKT